MSLRLTQEQYAEIFERNKPQPKRHKYGAKTDVVNSDGTKSQSKKEATRRIFLEHRERLGEISNLEFQKKYLFEHNGVKICSYVADFQYVENGTLVVEDTKSEATRKIRVYRVKVKLMLAFYGITIKES